MAAPPAPVPAHGSYLPSYAVITKGKKREMPALQSVDHLHKDASLYSEKRSGERKRLRRDGRPS